MPRRRIAPSATNQPSTRLQYMHAAVIWRRSRSSALTVLLHKLTFGRGAPYDDFPESGWDKICKHRGYDPYLRHRWLIPSRLADALNVKSMFYTTVGLHSLLTKGATAKHPSRVINIASMAGIMTTDVTTGDEGGLSAPGSGTFSYGPSKAACIHLSKMQASKLMSHHVTVNCICPGVFPSK